IGDRRRPGRVGAVPPATFGGRWPMREGQREAPPHAAWRGCPRCLRSASTQKEGPGNKSNGAPQPSPKKGKTQKESVQSRCSCCRVLCPLLRASPRELVAANAQAWTAAGCGPDHSPVPAPAEGGNDKTLSCPCLVSKRKNFVSRARTTPLRSVVLFPPKTKRTKPLPCPPGNPVPRLGSRPSGSAKVEPVWGPPGGGGVAAARPTPPAHTRRPATRQQEQRVSAPLSQKRKNTERVCTDPLPPLPGALPALPCAVALQASCPCGRWFRTWRVAGVHVPAADASSWLLQRQTKKDRQ